MNDVRLLHHGPSATVVDIGSGFLSSENNVISVKSLLSKVVAKKENLKAIAPPVPARGSVEATKEGEESGPTSSVNVMNGSSGNSSSSSSSSGNNISSSSSSSGSKSSSNTSNGSSSAGVGGSSVNKAGQGLSYFNRFIEEMEKKYSAQHVNDVGDESDEGWNSAGDIEQQNADNDSDSENDESRSKDGAEKEGAKDGAMDGDGTAKKKRKRRTDDFYDEADDFIDDSDVYGELGAQIEAKTKKTKHSGFFISSGELEVLPDPDAPVIIDKPLVKVKQRTSLKGKKDSINTPGASVASGAANKANKENGALQGVTAARDKLPVLKEKRKRASKAEKEAEIIEQAKKILQQQYASQAQAGDKVDSTLADLKSLDKYSAPPLKKKATIASQSLSSVSAVSAASMSPPPSSPADSSKPSWDHLVTAEVRRVILAFKDFARASSASDLDKNSAIPLSLDEALLSLDKTVKSHISPSDLRKHSGYLEAIAEALGGKISANKVKLALLAAVIRAEAIAARERLENETNILCISMAEKEAPYKPPAPRKKKSDAGGEEGKDSEKDKEKEKEVEGEAKMNLEKGDKGEDKSDGKSDDKDQEKDDGGDATSETAGAAPQYQYAIRWTAELKLQLLKVDLCVERWVECENKRLKRFKVMSSEEKRAEGLEAAKGAEGPAMLTHSEEQMRYFRKIIDSIPHKDVCKGASAKDLRNALAAAKRELKKSKEKAGAGVSGTPSTEVKAKASTSSSSSFAPAPVSLITKDSTVTVVPIVTAKSGAGAFKANPPPAEKPATAKAEQPASAQHWQPVRPFSWDDFEIANEGGTTDTAPPKPEG